MGLIERRGQGFLNQGTQGDRLRTGEKVVGNLDDDPRPGEAIWYVEIVKIRGGVHMIIPGRAIISATVAEKDWRN